MQPGDYCKISTGKTLCFFLLTLHLNSYKQNIFISLQYAIEINVHCTCRKFWSEMVNYLKATVVECRLIFRPRLSV